MFSKINLRQRLFFISWIPTLTCHILSAPRHSRNFTSKPAKAFSLWRSWHTLLIKLLFRQSVANTRQSDKAERDGATFLQNLRLRLWSSPGCEAAGGGCCLRVRQNGVWFFFFASFLLKLQERWTEKKAFEGNRCCWTQWTATQCDFCRGWILITENPNQALPISFTFFRHFESRWLANPPPKKKKNARC